MEIKNKYYGTPRYKSKTIYNWKGRGIVHDDFDALFEEYIATTACQHCHTPFKSTLDRCIDHNHDTGQVRLIVCHKCNVKDTYINWPDGCSKKQSDERYRQQNRGKISERGAEYYQQNREKIAERGAEYRQQNKEKIAEQASEVIKCECGTDATRTNIARHRKSQKHQKSIMKIEMK